MQWARVLVILSGPAGQRNLTYRTVGYQEFKRKSLAKPKPERPIRDCARL